MAGTRLSIAAGNKASLQRVICGSDSIAGRCLQPTRIGRGVALCAMLVSFGGED
jgi:hypothetical protein